MVNYRTVLVAASVTYGTQSAVQCSTVSEDPPAQWLTSGDCENGMKRHWLETLVSSLVRRGELDRLATRLFPSPAASYTVPYRKLLSRSTIPFHSIPGRQSHLKWMGAQLNNGLSRVGGDGDDTVIERTVVFDRRAPRGEQVGSPLLVAAAPGRRTRARLVLRLQPRQCSSSSRERLPESRLVPVPTSALALAGARLELRPRRRERLRVRALVRVERVRERLARGLHAEPEAEAHAHWCCCGCWRARLRRSVRERLRCLVRRLVVQLARLQLVVDVRLELRHVAVRSRARLEQQVLELRGGGGRRRERRQGEQRRRQRHGQWKRLGGGATRAGQRSERPERRAATCFGHADVRDRVQAAAGGEETHEEHRVRGGQHLHERRDRRGWRRRRRRAGRLLALQLARLRRLVCRRARRLHRRSPVMSSAVAGAAPVVLVGQPAVVRRPRRRGAPARTRALVAGEPRFVRRRARRSRRRRLVPVRARVQAALDFASGDVGASCGAGWREKGSCSAASSRLRLNLHVERVRSGGGLRWCTRGRRACGGGRGGRT